MPKKSGNIICQMLASWFRLRNRSLKWHTSSTILSFLSIYSSFDPVRFSSGLGQDSIYFAAPVFRTYTNILQAPGLAAAKTIQTKKICSQDLRTAAAPIVQMRRHDFYWNVARIHTREVIKGSSFPKIFESCALW